MPPATNLATVPQLVAQGQATSLDLRGDTLFVTTADGRHYRVDDVDEATLGEILPEAIGTTAEVSISSGDTLANLAFVATTLLQVVLPFVPMLVAIRWFRRPLQPRPAG